MATSTKMASLGARTVQNATRFLASPPTVRVVACPFSCVPVCSRPFSLAPGWADSAPGLFICALSPPSPSCSGGQVRRACMRLLGFCATLTLTVLSCTHHRRRAEEPRHRPRADVAHQRRPALAARVAPVDRLAHAGAAPVLHADGRGRRPADRQHAPAALRQPRLRGGPQPGRRRLRKGRAARRPRRRPLARDGHHRRQHVQVPRRLRHLGASQLALSSARAARLAD